MLLGAEGSRNPPAADDLAGRVRVTVPLVTTDEMNSIRNTRLEPSEIVETEHETYVLYTIPNPEAQGAQSFLRLRVATAEGLIQEGVFGLTEPNGNRVKANWAKFKLSPRGVSNRETARHQSTVTL